MVAVFRKVNKKGFNMEKLYPILKRTKTCLGNPIPENTGFLLAYCPICNRRLSAKKVHPKYGDPWKYEWKKAKQKNKDELVGKPIHCEQCGTLIHPLS